MTKNNLRWMRLAGIALAFAALAAAAPAARAQVDPSAPVTTRHLKGKILWLKAEVIHADNHELVVRETGNEMAVHTFTYGPKAEQQIEKVIAAGGYQRGDAIKIHYESGQTIALEIKGKPSRPI